MKPLTTARLAPRRSAIAPAPARDSSAAANCTPATTPTASAPSASVPSTYRGSTGMGRPIMKKPTNTASVKGSNCRKMERAGPWAAGMAPAAEEFDMVFP
ncbi:hypothetical protein D3C87_1750730 [compost metagenome]